MTRKLLKELIENMGYEDSIIFENPSYLDAIVGFSDTGQVIYDYDLMVESLMKKEGMDMEEAAEFIDYNTVRALPYCSPSEKRPIILYKYDT